MGRLATALEHGHGMVTAWPYCPRSQPATAPEARACAQGGSLGRRGAGQGAASEPPPPPRVAAEEMLLSRARWYTRCPRACPEPRRLLPLRALRLSAWIGEHAARFPPPAASAHVPPPRVLELGAGIGIAGLACWPYP